MAKDEGLDPNKLITGFDLGTGMDRSALLRVALEQGHVFCEEVSEEDIRRRMRAVLKGNTMGTKQDLTYGVQMHLAIDCLVVEDPLYPHEVLVVHDECNAGEDDWKRVFRQYLPVPVVATHVDVNDVLAERNQLQQQVYAANRDRDLWMRLTIWAIVLNIAVVAALLFAKAQGVIMFP